jgi:hypothetical protein
MRGAYTLALMGTVVLMEIERGTRRIDVPDVEPTR